LQQDNKLKINQSIKVLLCRGDNYFVESIEGEVLDKSNTKIQEEQQSQIILEFVNQSAGLSTLQPSLNDKVIISQVADGKELAFVQEDIEEVLQRQDSDGKPFLQVNFKSGKKILLTDNLIGFKPALCRGLDMDKLPKVVTTPDILSVVEAIEETLGAEGTSFDELEVLRRVFDSVLMGAESVGFDLTSERVWLHQFCMGKRKASA